MKNKDKCIIIFLKNQSGRWSEEGWDFSLSYFPPLPSLLHLIYRYMNIQTFSRKLTHVQGFLPNSSNAICTIHQTCRYLQNEIYSYFHEAGRHSSMWLLNIIGLNLLKAKMLRSRKFKQADLSYAPFMQALSPCIGTVNNCYVFQSWNFVF